VQTPKKIDRVVSPACEKNAGLDRSSVARRLRNEALRGERQNTQVSIQANKINKK
jgi:hypothetical protein